MSQSRTLLFPKFFFLAKMNQCIIRYITLHSIEKFHLVCAAGMPGPEGLVRFSTQTVIPEQNPNIGIITPYQLVASLAFTNYDTVV